MLRFAVEDKFGTASASKSADIFTLTYDTGGGPVVLPIPLAGLTLTDLGIAIGLATGEGVLWELVEPGYATIPAGHLIDWAAAFPTIPATVNWPGLI